ncbi:MAG: hypothetical protein DRR16_23190 [Candidatus Parabeggiatoa sp. nov. 3]|nr:MAG: hypothetical protein DRR00_18755 [Gammaproteobacteria bacterium]RKZ60732.1 MAG: hypothetical protein DRQ99_21595 [Gammaproteobacteria bacterium]RKZ80821.1 MAG: hypothetical protein DRR16_23190 [Gammaproteobacteria bacterium]HEW97085.1 HNH endonuclease [Beggiatoa sp.]
MANAWQRLVRGFVRAQIDKINAKKNPHKPPRPLTKSNKRIPIPKSVRYTVLHRDHYQCVACGRKAAQVELEIDHIVPVSKGGTNDLNNLQTLCKECNRGKAARIF